MSNITLVLSDAEQQAFSSVLDAVLRQGGLSALDVVYHFRAVLQNALATAVRASALPAAAPVSNAGNPQPAATAAAHTAAPAGQHAGILGEIAGIFSGHAQPAANGSGTHQAHITAAAAPGAATIQPQPAAAPVPQAPAVAAPAASTPAPAQSASAAPAPAIAVPAASA